jgi:hypothetical protein
MLVMALVQHQQRGRHKIEEEPPNVAKARAKAPLPWQREQAEVGRRAAKRQVCPRCAVEVYTGLDDDWMGFQVVVDVEPIGPEAEIWAALDGRPSYSLRPGSRGSELSWRDDYTIGRPSRHPVLLEHRCNHKKGDVR